MTKPHPAILIHDPDAGFYAQAIAEAFPGQPVIAAPDLAEALRAAPGAGVLVGLAPRLPPDLLAAAEGIEWLQALTTGVDNLLQPGALRPDVALTNCSGIHGPQMSELAFLLMLALLRRFPAMLDNQHARHWQAWEQPLLAGKTLCILGLGAIATELVRRARAFDMRVTGVSDGRAGMEGLARVFPRSELAEAVAEADVLVVLVPYSPATHHIVDARVLAAMKPTAILVNIARGGCVDEAALLDALRAGRIAGAGLDVFATEPLPAGHPLWDAPNCIVTPHVGGKADIYARQVLPTLLRNIGLWREGGTAALPHRIALQGDRP